MAKTNFKRIDNGFGCGYSWLCTLNGAEIEKSEGYFDVWKNGDILESFKELKEAKEFCEKIVLNSGEFMVGFKAEDCTKKTIFLRAEEKGRQFEYTIFNTDYQPCETHIDFINNKRYNLTYENNFRTIEEAFDYLHYLEIKF